ncbi:aconitate hydratase 1 [Georgfuchsia toluolica]|uniref:Aconitate hydratase n=1 Tax=Georgfuchsia toluolica TaxID=424218 RepID=A0A916J273_9PROT|nr:aconitate hydratase AcnA [Georgfuchsia toluolica]CAG4883324.1 aconitate hydratase 1 [Georgfuchsia toluolica]
MTQSLYDSFQSFSLQSGATGYLYSLPALERAGLGKVSRLPVSIRLVLESVLRNCDGRKITERHIRQLAAWQPNEPRSEEIPFVVARIVLQDFTGVPLLCDLAAMRGVARKLGKAPKIIEPLVPVDLVVDHSVQVDYFRQQDALDLNMKLEFQRNRERYQFMKWGMQAFDTFRVVPPGVGIVHQVNLEYLARGVHAKKVDGKTLYYPDTLVGTDSHTTMINGIGVVGWGVGGIEAEAGMLGQPVYFLTPDVVGFELKGKLREGCTATDLVLTVTEQLRREKVVGKFVEFFGEGVEALTLADRATIANMAPEYGATMGFFPVDDATISYFQGTGRTAEEIDAFVSYFKAQGLYGVPKEGQIDYSQVVTLDLAGVTPSLAGPKRPQDRIEIGKVKANFIDLFSKPASANGFSRPAAELRASYVNSDGVTVKNGDILIAAITSCTNTSNPGVLLAAGLVAKKAVQRGLKVAPHIKTSLAPGSRVVTDYLKKAGLLSYLEQLGFPVTAYGCTTCIGNSGDLTPALNQVIQDRQLVCAAVLSGNRNFEARIHPNIKANYLASPPLVVAYAIAGTMRKDLMTEPLGKDKEGNDVWIGDIWPTSAEVQALMKLAMNPAVYAANYRQLTAKGDLWSQIASTSGDIYDWPLSTYIANPPFFDDFALAPPVAGGNITGARALGIFGDSITTDHISPAGSIKEASPAGLYLIAHGVGKTDFNSYGARRGNHEVMVRGTFANVRIKNLMLPPQADGGREEGGITLHQPSGEKLSIFEAAMKYLAAGTPTVIFAGEEYGTGSSRDWAAKGTRLLGVKAVVARSFERIHRSNLVGMGVLPLQFIGSTSAQSLGIQGDESFDILGLEDGLKPRQKLTLVIHGKDGERRSVRVLLRIDTPIEVDYYRHGGILPYVLRELLI